MSDPVAKANALAERALNRSQEARDKAKQDRAMLWHRIQTEAPQLADTLEQIKERMGKPILSNVRFDSDQSKDWNAFEISD